MIDHTEWCARDHQCGVSEHRSAPIMVDLPGYGRAALVRVRADDAHDHAEIRIRIALAAHEASARRQLRTVLTDLRALVVRAAAHRPQPRRRQPEA
jgi:hypothetical protein